MPIQEVTFDPEKAQCCVVESGQGLTHGSGGKGYGLASTGISSGCYQWKVLHTFFFFFYTKVQKFGVKTTLFDLNYSKSCNIVKYFTNLK